MERVPQLTQTSTLSSSQSTARHARFSVNIGLKFGPLAAQQGAVDARPKTSESTGSKPLGPDYTQPLTSGTNMGYQTSLLANLLGKTGSAATWALQWVAVLGPAGLACSAVANDRSQSAQSPQHASQLTTPRSIGMGSLPNEWYCFGRVDLRHSSTDCYPNATQCTLAQSEFQVQRTALSCYTAPQAYCTTPATTNSQPTLAFSFTNRTKCFAAPHYCEAQRRDGLERGTPMSECQLIQSRGFSSFPPL